MYIGSLFNKKFCPGVSYSYFERGTDIPYPPDKICEENATENTNLFEGKPIAFDRLKLMRNAVDIKFSFSKNVFVDHFTIVLGEEEEVGAPDSLSHIKKIEVLTEKDGAKNKIGVYRSETEKDITDKNLTVSVAYHCDNVTLRIHALVRPIVIEKLDILGAVDLDDALFPMPKSVKENDNVLTLSSITGISANGDDALFAAEYLNECLAEKFGITYKIADSTTCPIRISLCDMEKEGYELTVNQGGVTICAADKSGLLYACCTLIQLMNDKSIRCVEIKDSPFMQIRGFHFALPEKKDLSFLKRMVKYLFVPMRYNTLFLQITASMRFDRFPEINEAWITAGEKYEKDEWPQPAHYRFLCHTIWEKDEVRELVNYMRSYGIDVIPEIQSLGHSQYITTAYPELAEIAETENETGINDLFKAREGLTGNKFYPDACCPNHPRYYETIFGIVDEVIDVFEPKDYICMGHDEVYSIGLCKRCRDLAPEDILATEVTALNEYIMSKGLRMMIWTDMFHKLPYDYHKTEKAVDKIPNNIIMLDFPWYFLKQQDCEQRFVERGFDVLFGNFYSSGFPRFDSRKKTSHLLGAEVSAWLPVGELSFGFNGKMFDIIYSANCMWNFEHRQDMRRTYNEIIKNIIPDIRGQMNETGIDRFDKAKINISEYTAPAPCELRDGIGKDGVMAVNLEKTSISVPINQKTERLYFTHATDTTAPRITWGEPYKIGEYEILYEDNTKEAIDILYAANILEYTRMFAKPMKADVFGHLGYFATYLADPICGKTAMGDDYTLYELTWVNPHKDKKILSVTLKHEENTDAQIMLFNLLCAK